MIVPAGLSVHVDANVDGPGHIELFGDERGGIGISDQVHHYAGAGTPADLDRGRTSRSARSRSTEGELLMDTTSDRLSGRHPVNIGHLVMGLAFLGIVGVWALVQTDTVTGDDIRWLLPIPWVVAGVVGLAVDRDHRLPAVRRQADRLGR